MSELKERWLYVLFRVLYNVPMLLSCQLLRWAGLTTEVQHFPWHEPLRLMPAAVRANAGYMRAAERALHFTRTLDVICGHYNIK